MARSPHAYVRGSTVKFYEWLASPAAATLPAGPTVWICGDCHVGNLGPVANAKGEIDIQIRDLDQTVIGNPAHDLIRLALSLASAARGSNLPGVTTARMLEQITEGYLGEFTPDVEVTPEPPQVVSAALQTAVKRDWKKLARERIRDTKPHIPLGKKFWPLSKDERRGLVELVHSGAVQHLITALHSRATGANIELVDAAYWVKGCSSLGLMRYALLVSVDDGAGRSLSLIDVKEAVKPAAPRAARVRMPTHNGERVLEGARRLSPFLGDRMASATVLDHAVFVRELLPEDLKLEIETLDRDEAVVAARFLAGVVGRAHARQLGADDRKAWATELGKFGSKNLDAPSWLWKSVVDLMATHEAAYLEHCRRYAEIAA
jgi:uncharacterized protein (DUF2252 family)